MYENELERRILRMAVHARGTPFGDWPGWSTGELLMVALVLNDGDALAAMNYTIVQAFDRVDMDAARLRAIERKVADLVPERQIDGRVIYR